MDESQELLKQMYIQYMEEMSWQTDNLTPLECAWIYHQTDISKTRIEISQKQISKNL